MGSYWGRILLAVLALAFAAAMLVRSWRSQDESAILRVILIVAITATVYVVLQELVFVTGYDSWFAGRPSPALAATVRERTVRIERVDDIGPEALARIGDAVEGRSLVGLGENHHGVEEFSRVKLALIRYLHEERDFDLLLFESPFFDLLPIDEAQSIERRGGSLVRALYSVWWTGTNQELFRYIASTWRTASPLHVAAIDPKHPGSCAERAAAFVGGILLRHDPALAAEHRRAAAAGAVLFRGDRPEGRGSNELVAATIAHYRRIAATLDSLAGSRAAAGRDEAVRLRLAGQVAINLAVYAEMRSLPLAEADLVRDRQMARNVDFLREVLQPGVRTLLWAHNGHLRRSPERIERGDFYNFFLRWVPAARIVAPNLGNHLHRRHGDDYYALGLSMAGGRMGAPGGRTGHARPPRRNSLEYLLARGGSRAAFLDLARPAPGGDIFRNTRVQMLDSALYWRWIVSAEQYDGVLVVRDVTPARYLH